MGMVIEMNDKTKLKILTVIILILLAICGVLIYKIINTSTCNAAGLSAKAQQEVAYESYSNSAVRGE